MVYKRAIEMLLISLLLILGTTPMKISNTEKISSLAMKEKQNRVEQAGNLLKGANIAKECIKAVMETMNPDFCWKSGGDAGKTPYGCPRGWFRSGAICYENCRRHYHFKDGFCRDGSSWYVPSQKTNFESESTCEQGYYKWGALCYKDCANIGMDNCGIGACSQDSSTCGSQIASMALDVVTGVATFALFVVSMGTSSGGASQAMTASGRAGTQAMTDAVKKSSWQKLKSTFSKQNFEKFKKRAAEQFRDNLKDIPLDKGAEWYAKNVCEDIYKGIQAKLGTQSEPEDVDLESIAKKFDVLGVSDIVDACKKGEKEKCAQKSLEFASTFDPTGLLTIAAAFVLPTCNVDPIVSNQDPLKVLSTSKYFCQNCSDLVSNVQEAGNRGVEYLDRHPMTCASNQLLNFFSFTFDYNANKLISNYKCITPSSAITSCLDSYSNWNELPRNTGSINFLDRHIVDCGNGFFQSLHLTTNGGQMRYKARCCTIQHSFNSWKLFSTNKGGVSNWYVDQFNKIDGVDAGPLSAIFFINPKTSDSHFFYEFKAGRVIYAGEASEYYQEFTNWDDAGEGSVWFLDRHNPKCSKDNSAMTSFNLERSGNLIRYSYKCITNTRINTNSDFTYYTEWNDV